jgi:chondroitin 4-sulfotransferase 11
MRKDQEQDAPRAAARRFKPKDCIHYVGRMVNLLRRLITRGAYMGWSYLAIDSKKVLYLVIQKAACTSIKASMAGVDSDAFFVEVIQEVRETGHTFTEIDASQYADYFVFTFVRNPFERLISCYENKYHIKLPEHLRDRPLPYDYYLLGYLRRDRGFCAFAQRVCRIPDRIADNHFASQCFMIERMGRNPKPDFIGHFERLVEEYEPIREKYDFMKLPHHNKTPHTRNWMDYYDLKTAQMVYRRYRQDIERFGYQKTYEQLVAYLQGKA